MQRVRRYTFIMRYLLQVQLCFELYLQEFNEKNNVDFLFNTIYGCRQMAVGVEEMRGASTLANGGSRADPEAGVPLLHQ